jgi:hypothetical protein
MMNVGRKAFGTMPAPLSLRSIGDVYMLDVSGREVIRALRDTDWEVALKMPVEKMLDRPILFFQTILDHTHSSYSQDLLVTARLRRASETLNQAPAAAIVSQNGNSNGHGPQRGPTRVTSGLLR